MAAVEFLKFPCPALLDGDLSTEFHEILDDLGRVISQSSFSAQVRELGRDVPSNPFNAQYGAFRGIYVFDDQLINRAYVRTEKADWWIELMGTGNPFDLVKVAEVLHAGRGLVPIEGTNETFINSIIIYPETRYSIPRRSPGPIYGRLKNHFPPPPMSLV